MPCLTPSDRSQSGPFQHCPLISTIVLSVFVKCDRSACAVETGDRDRAGSREPKNDGIRKGAVLVELEGDSGEDARRVGGRCK